jgi:hypothetical protein
MVGKYLLLEMKLDQSVVVVHVVDAIEPALDVEDFADKTVAVVQAYLQALEMNSKMLQVEETGKVEQE